MGAKLIRSAHSPIVREAQDCSAALLDRRGNVVAQSELIALQLGSITHTFRPCLELYDLDEIEPDDFFINNDPFHGGQHLPDIFIFSPVFFEDELVGFSATVVHHIDLGGGAPGLNPKAGDIHQEGLVFPPTKYSLTRDWNGGGLERFIASNVRMPEATIGDLNAQFAANAIGAERIRELCRKFGVDVVDAAMVEMLDYAERRIRSAIRAVPDGEYHGEAMIDDDGIGQAPVRVKAKLTVDGDGIEVDFARLRPSSQNQHEQPLRVDRSRRRRLPQVGADGPGRADQRWQYPSDQGDGGPRQRPQPDAAGAGPRTPVAELPRLQRGDDGAFGSRAGTRHRARLRHDDGGLPQRIPRR